jgi:hypothetical protein
MNKYFLTFILLILLQSIWTQELTESDFYKLPMLPGKVITYYSEGHQARAEYLKALVEDAIGFFEKRLGDTIDIILLVMDRKDWKNISAETYPIPSISKDPVIIETGVPELFKIKLPKNEMLYNRNKAFVWDFVSIHELGHYISQDYDYKNKTKTISAWSAEFFADYIQMGFLNEKIPNWQFPSFVKIAFKYLPLKYKSLEDYSKNMNIVNCLLYQSKLQELAYKIFKKSGWNFMNEYLIKCKSKYPIDKSLIVKTSIINIREIEPEVFDEWLSGMRKTYLPWLFLSVLLMIICGLRYIDNSNLIFNNQGIKTKKVYKFLGVPTFSIFTYLKKIETPKIRRRLILIIVIRPMMYILISLIILMLVLALF